MVHCQMVQFNIISILCGVHYVWHLICFPELLDEGSSDEEGDEDGESGASDDDDDDDEDNEQKDEGFQISYFCCWDY